MVVWSGQREEVEEVDVVRRELVLNKHVRTKYRCRCGASHSSRLAARLHGGRRVALDFAIEVAVCEFRKL